MAKVAPRRARTHTHNKRRQTINQNDSVEKRKKEKKRRLAGLWPCINQPVSWGKNTNRKYTQRRKIKRRKCKELVFVSVGEKERKCHNTTIKAKIPVSKILSHDVFVVIYYLEKRVTMTVGWWFLFFFFNLRFFLYQKLCCLLRVLGLLNLTVKFTCPSTRRASAYRLRHPTYRLDQDWMTLEIIYKKKYKQCKEKWKQ